MRCRFLIPLLLPALILLPACTPADDFDAGRPITRDELAALSAELFTNATEPETRPYSDREPNTYYWTSSGQVYHKYRDCIHLKNAQRIEQGSWILARTKGSPCSSCCDD